MEEQEKPAEKLISTAGQIVETYRDLISLTIVENVALGTSLYVVGIVLAAFTCFVLLFAALGFAWWIGETMDNMKAGFFIAGSVFLLTLIVLIMAARKGLLPFLQNIVIKKMYEKD